MQTVNGNMQNKKTMVLVLAGPNGSGKSTLSEFFEKVENILTLTILLQLPEWITKKLPS